LKKCIEFDDHKGEISVINSVTRMRTKEESGYPPDEELTFTASPFHETDKVELRELKQETTSSLFADP
jgi:hypothetical protein